MDKEIKLKPKQQKENKQMTKQHMEICKSVTEVMKHDLRVKRTLYTL